MDDRQITIEQAEEFAGKRLDRRYRYAILPDLDGKPALHHVATWTDGCSGCAYPDGSHEGCEECGYTGKVRHSMWLPASAIDVDKDMRREARQFRRSPVNRPSNSWYRAIVTRPATTACGFCKRCWRYFWPATANCPACRRD